MATFSGLPDEIILAVIVHLEALWPTSNSNSDSPIYWSSKAVESSAQQTKLTQDLFSLLSTCRRLAILLQPLAYKTVSFNQSRKVFAKFLATHLVDDSTVNYPVTMTEEILGLPRQNLVLFDRLLGLPRLKSVVIHDCAPHGLVNAVGHVENALIGSSKVTTVTARCDAIDLHALLRLPCALNELSFEWASGSEGYDHHEVLEKMSDLADALHEHMNSLRRLTLTRFQPGELRTQFYQPWPVVERIDLRGMSCVTELRIIRAFLVGSSLTSDWNVHKTLPPRLQVLTVFYDDTRYRDTPFLQELAEDDIGWSGTLAANKRAVPELKVVSILSREWRDEWSKNEQRAERLIRPLRDAFETVGVRLKVDLDVQWGEENWN